MQSSKYTTNYTDNHAVFNQIFEIAVKIYKSVYCASLTSLNIPTI